MARRKCPDCGEAWDALIDDRCSSCGLSVDDLELASDFLVRVQARDDGDQREVGFWEEERRKMQDESQ